MSCVAYITREDQRLYQRTDFTQFESAYVTDLGELIASGISF